MIKTRHQNAVIRRRVAQRGAHARLAAADDDANRASAANAREERERLERGLGLGASKKRGCGASRDERGGFKISGGRRRAQRVAGASPNIRRRRRVRRGVDERVHRGSQRVLGRQTFRLGGEREERGESGDAERRAVVRGVGVWIVGAKRLRAAHAIRRRRREKSSETRARGPERVHVARHVTRANGAVEGAARDGRGEDERERRGAIDDGGDVPVRPDARGVEERGETERGGGGGVRGTRRCHRADDSTGARDQRVAAPRHLRRGGPGRGPAATSVATLSLAAATSSGGALVLIFAVSPAVW